MQNKNLRYIVVAILFLLSLLFGGGCARIEKVASYGHQHKVSQYSGGSKINEWVSTGKVISEKGSDGYYFHDVKGKYIEVSGHLVIERL